MKKLMTSTIILLPLLLLAIMLASGAITSMFTHVYVESVEFVDSGTLVLVMKDEEDPPTEQLAVNVFPLRAESREVVFSVDDKNVASVDENGIVTAKFYGETYISAVSTENKAASARRKLIVTDTFVHEIVINKGYAADMYEDSTQQLSATVYPQEAANRSVTWSSSDESILSVGADGTVTAKGAGKATITATSGGDGEVKASVEITGHKKITDIATDQTLVVTSLTESKFPEVTPIPADADVTLAFQTDDPDIATVDAEGNIRFKKEGHVVVTVTATDFGNKTIEKKKEYTSTDGYYLPPLFAQKEYTVDYDAYKNADKALPIPFAETLDGSYREFIGVTYSVDHVLSFDEEAKEFRFAGPMPEGTRSLRATVKARIYDAAKGMLTDYEDGFTLNVLRNAKGISVSYKGTENVGSIPISGRTLTFTEEPQSGGSFAVIHVDPKNHTNKIVYSLTEGGNVAKITAAGVLTFEKAGAAKVKISLVDAEEEETAAKEIEVIYTPLGAKEREIEISEGGEKKVVLNLNDDGADTGVIRFASPENATVSYTVEQSGEVVRLEEGEGVRRIVPVSGGFATVKIDVTPDAGSGAVQKYSVMVYVDRSVQAEDLAVAFNGSPCADTFRTVRDSVNYSVTVTDKNGSMTGKKLYVTFHGAKSEADAGVLTHSGTVSFAGKDSVTVTFGAEYTTEAAEFGAENGSVSVSRTVTTSKGALDKAPTVTYRDGTLQTEGTDLTFENINTQIALTVVREFTPADFDLSAHPPVIDGTDYVGVNISDDGATITLTAKKVCFGQRMLLSVGGKTFPLNVTVRALAEELSVTCGNRSLKDGEHYETLLDGLSFRVNIADRSDGQAISDQGIKYSLNGSDWNEIEGGNVQIGLSSLTDNGTLRFRSADGGAGMEFSLKKVSLDDFGLEFSVRTSSERAVVGKAESVAEENAVSYSLPSDMQGALTITVTPDRDDLLGGFGTDEEFERLISVTLPGQTDWRTAYEALRGAITVSGDFSGVYVKELTINGGNHTLRVELSHMDLASVEFTGFDSRKPEDVYKGYQQVRVFAKHSDYDGKTVDYFRVPLVALSDLVQKTPVDPALLTWKLTRYTGNEAGETIATQRSDEVTYCNAVYTIRQDGSGYVLKDQNGTTVVGTDGKYTEGQPHVTWVDVYSEKEQGIARIYFGDFGGLSESDVQNDYFGNFDERAEWSTPQTATDDKGGGIVLAPSPNAYTFLRAEAGDGADNGRNCHFNFNVLQDDTLVNVFNAEGYYAHSNIVLHENLYGPGELEGNAKLDEATQKGLFLNEAKNLGKTLIYGNGYQVNLHAKTASMANYSESDGITIERAYNTVIKCANPTDEISNKYQKMVLKMAYAYYCDLSYYYKFNPSGNAFYAKNTIFSSIFKTAVQLYYNENMYAENCVFTECGTAIQVDNSSNLDPHIYIKGGFDALNYFNNAALNNLNPIIGMLYSSVVYNVKDYLEWHGKTFMANAGSYADPNVDKIYVNILLFGYASLTENIFVWDNDSYKEAIDTPLKNGSKILSKSLYSQYYAWTYDTLDENGTRLDKATVEATQFGKATVTADMSQLFTEKRYIRLQCEFKKPGVKNYDHILWHRQEVYRDKSLLPEERKSHIDDLKESLKNTEWDDGSGVDGNGDPYEPVAQLTAMISQAVVPGKRSYVD